MYSVRGNLHTSFHLLQKVALAANDDEELEDPEGEKKQHKKKKTTHKRTISKVKQEDFVRKQPEPETETRQREKEREIRMKQQEEEQEKKLDESFAEIQERLAMEDEDRIGAYIREKEKELQRKKNEEIRKQREQPDEEIRQRSFEEKREKDQKDQLKQFHEDITNSNRENMIYEDELAFWVRKPLPLMNRAQLRSTLPVIRKEDAKFITRRMQNCEKKVRAIRDSLEKLTKQAQSTPKGGLAKIEKEKRRLEYDKADLKLTIYMLKATPYRKFYDRDVEEKVGQKEKDDIYKIMPKTGQETQLKDEQIRINFDKTMQLLNDDMIKKVPTRKEEQETIEQKKAQIKRWNNILKRAQLDDEADEEQKRAFEKKEKKQTQMDQVLELHQKRKEQRKLERLKRLEDKRTLTRRIAKDGWYYEDENVAESGTESNSEQEMATLIAEVEEKNERRAAIKFRLNKQGEKKDDHDSQVIMNLAEVMAKTKAEKEKQQDVIDPQEEDRMIWDILERGSDEEDQLRRIREKRQEKEKKKKKRENEAKVVFDFDEEKYNSSEIDIMRPVVVEEEEEYDEDSQETERNKWEYIHPWEIPQHPPYPVEMTQMDNIPKTDITYINLYDDETVMGTQYVVDATIEYKPPDRPRPPALEEELKALIQRYKDALKIKNLTQVRKYNNQLMDVFTNRSVVSRMRFMQDEELVELLMSLIGDKPTTYQLDYVYTLTLLSRKPENHPAFIKFNVISMLQRLIRKFRNEGPSTLAVAEAIAFLSADQTMREQLLRCGALQYMQYVLRIYGKNDPYISRYASLFIFTILKHENEIEAYVGNKLLQTVSILMNLVNPKNSPTEDVLRLSIATLQKIATRADRPNDPVLKVGDDKAQKTEPITSPIIGTQPALTSQRAQSFINPQQQIIPSQAPNKSIHAKQTSTSESSQLSNSEQIPVSQSNNFSIEHNRNFSQLQSKSSDIKGITTEFDNEKSLQLDENEIDDEQQSELLSKQYLNALLTSDAPKVLLDVIREYMDIYYDVTDNTLSILWQIALQTEYHSKNWLVYDPIQVLYFVHPLFLPTQFEQDEIKDKRALFALHNSIANNTLSTLCLLVNKRPQETLPILADMEASILFSNIIMRLPKWHKYDDAVVQISLQLLYIMIKRGEFNFNINKQTLATSINEHIISYTQGTNTPNAERQIALASGLGILWLLTENDTNILRTIQQDDLVKGTLAGFKIVYNVPSLSEVMIYESQKFTSRVEELQTTKKGKENENQFAWIVDQYMSGQQPNQERDSPQSNALNTMFYGMQILRKVIMNDSKSDISKKIIQQDGMKVLALVGQQLLEVSIVFYKDQFNACLSLINFSKLKDPKRYERIQYKERQIVKNKEEYQDAAFELAEEQFELQLTELQGPDAVTNITNQKEGNKDKILMTVQQKERIDQLAEQRAEREGQLKSNTLKLSGQENENILTERTYLAQEQQKIGRKQTFRLNYLRKTNDGDEYWQSVRPLNEGQSQQTDQNSRGEFPPLESNQIQGQSPQITSQLLSQRKPKQQGPSLKIFLEQLIANQMKGKLSLALREMKPLDKFRRIAKQARQMNMFGMMDNREASNTMTLTRHMRRPQLSDREIKINGPQQSKLQQSSTNKDNQNKNPTTLNAGKDNQQALNIGNLKTSPRGSQVMSSNRKFQSLSGRRDDEPFNFNSADRAKSLHKELISQRKLTKTLDDEEDDDEDDDDSDSDNQNSHLDTLKVISEANTTYTALLATCHPLAIKDRVEETILLLTFCIYQLSRALNDEQRNKLQNADQKVLPSLFAIVKHFCKFSELLIKAEGSQSGSGYLSGSEKATSQSSQQKLKRGSFGAADRVGLQIDISGGANSEHAMEIMENSLNALRKLNPGELWKDEFKLCKNIAKMAFPQSKVFK